MRATGTVTLFDGFLGSIRKARTTTAGDDDARLPTLTDGEALRACRRAPGAAFHRTAAALFGGEPGEELEELGIGRPSTYAIILSTLRDRAYVRMDRNRFIPEDKGRIVTAFLSSSSSSTMSNTISLRILKRSSTKFPRVN